MLNVSLQGHIDSSWDFPQVFLPERQYIYSNYSQKKIRNLKSSKVLQNFYRIDLWHRSSGQTKLKVVLKIEVEEMIWVLF